MQNKMTTQDLILNLKAAGFEAEMIEQYLACREHGKMKEQIKLLAERRADLLEYIHKKEKQIGCLDYLVYQIRKEEE